MEFDPMEAIFLLIWCFFLYKAVFNNKRKKSTYKPPRENPDKISDENDGYDYEQLRRKIRRSWGEEKEEIPISYEPEEIEQNEKNKSLYSNPVSATIEEKLGYGLGTKQDTSSSSAGEKWDVGPVISRKEQGEVLELPALPRGNPKVGALKKWTARDAQKWIVYDAVFGAPRAKRAWRPYSLK